MSALLDDREVPHAFGGALAARRSVLRAARGTIDIDLNVFVDQAHARWLLEMLPPDVVWDEWTRSGSGATARFGSGGRTPPSISSSTPPCSIGRRRSGHIGAVRRPSGAVPVVLRSRRVQGVLLEDEGLGGPRRDGGCRLLDLDRTVGVIARYLGPEDERVARLLTLGAGAGPDAG